MIHLTTTFVGEVKDYVANLCVVQQCSGVCHHTSEETSSAAGVGSEYLDNRENPEETGPRNPETGNRSEPCKIQRSFSANELNEEK